MADTLDLLTLDEAKALLSIPSSNTDSDDDVARVVTAVSRKLDELCGPVVNRTVTAETYDGSTPSVRVKRAPVFSFTTVTEYDGTAAQVLTAESNVTKTATNYLYDNVTNRLWRRSNGADYCFPAGRRNVVLTYTAGRYTSTATVDARFKQAAGIIVKHLWTTDRTGGSELFGVYPTGFAMPARAEELLSDELINAGPFVG